MDAELRRFLSTITLSASFRPAYLAKGKEWMVVYWVVHPQSGEWKRKKEKLNHIRDRKTRLAFGEQRVRELNAILALGWNPFAANVGAHGGRTLMSACKAFIEGKVRERIRQDSLRSYQSLVSILEQWCIGQDLKELNVAGFTDVHARAFLNQSYVERKLSPRTFNNYHTFYVTLWNWLKEHGYVPENVFSGIKKKKVDPDGTSRRPPTPHERKLIRTYLERENPRFFTFSLLCFHCGIRPKEAYMLKPDNFHLKERFIHVPGYVAKNHRTQGVAIPDVLVPHLEALELDKQDLDHYVFSSGFQPGSRLCNSRDSGRAWSNLREAIGLSEEVTFYQLKHAGGEQLSRDGIGEVDLMNHLRHHDLSETSTYTRRTYKTGVRTVLKKASPF